MRGWRTPAEVLATLEALPLPDLDPSDVLTRGLYRSARGAVEAMPAHRAARDYYVAGRDSLPRPARVALLAGRDVGEPDLARLGCLLSALYRRAMERHTERHANAALVDSIPVPDPLPF